ncbi:MAG: hypothetical protein H3C35_06755 [Bacteroidetes bacterium]|nr:hypothetical protein [Bacteroidota bacterium]
MGKENRLYVFLFFGFIAFISTAVSQQSEKEEKQSVPLDFWYDQGNVQTSIPSLYENGQFYLSLDDICRTLGIFMQYDSAFTSAAGFYLTEANRFRINFAEGNTEIGARHDTLPASESASDRLHWYLLPSVFERMFSLTFTVDFSSLSISLVTNVTLPVVQAVERERQLKYLQTVHQEKISYPLLFPLERTIVQPGVLDYSLTANRLGNKNSYGYQFGAGSELFGGDINAELIGDVEQNRSSFSSQAVWRYPFEKEFPLTQLQIGNINSGGILPRDMRGILLNNEPLQPRELFTTFYIEEHTVPQWTVYLLKDNIIIAAQKADELGNVRFAVPLTYGSTNYDVRIYGPNGEQIEKRRRLEIPFSFTPPGELLYGLTAGENIYGNGGTATLYSEYGFSDKISQRLGLQVINDSVSTRNFFYSNSSFRLFDGGAVSLQAAYPYKYTAQFSNVHTSQISYNASYSLFSSDRILNFAKQKSAYQAQLFLPYDLSGLFLSGRMQYTGAQFEQSNYHSAVSSLTGFYRRTSVSVEAQMNETSTSFGAVNNTIAGIAVLHSLRLPMQLSKSFSGVLFSGAYYHNFSFHRPENIRAELSSNIFTGGRISFLFSHSFQTAQSQFGLQLVYEFDAARSTSFMQFSSRQQFSQNVRGAMAYDRAFHTVQFYNQQWAGNAAVRFIPFFDENGDGVKQPSEQILPDEMINTKGAAIFQRRSHSTQELWQMLPYNTYSAEVMVTSSGNAMLVPQDKYFSFTTGASVLQPIYIPFHSVGLIEGTAAAIRNGEQKPISGLTLHVYAEDNTVTDIPVFQDGAYYYVGLPLGKYRIEVDKKQLEILKLKAVPESIPFSITAVENSISGLDFQLLPLAP